MSNEEVVEFIRVRLAERMEPEIVSIVHHSLYTYIYLLYRSNRQVELTDVRPIFPSDLRGADDALFSSGRVDGRTRLRQHDRRPCVLPERSKFRPFGGEMLQTHPGTGGLSPHNRFAHP